MFEDRVDAGFQLANALEKWQNKRDTVVIALPRGGVVPAYIVAKELHLPLDVVMVKKIGHPNQPEFAIGAVSIDHVIISEHAGVSQQYIDNTVKEIQDLLKKRYTKYHGNKASIDLQNKTVIVIDDGIATGRTLFASLEYIKRAKPQKIIVAIPVAPAKTIETLEEMVDHVVCLETPDPFYSIGSYYRDFKQVSDQEVVDFLEKSTAYG